MKNEIIKGILNLIKVKSIITLLAAFTFVYLATNNKIETATVTTIIVMVFQSLFGKDKSDK